MANYIKIIPAIPHVGGQFITPAGEALNASRMDAALEGAQKFFALYGHNAGPYCLFSETFRRGYAEVPAAKDNPVQFGLAVLWAAKEYQEKNLMAQEIDRFLRS